VPGYYHPTFLYESLWCIGVGFLVIWADRRFTLGHGRAFALYVAAYCVGRGWIEYMRVDDAHHILGLRLNDWTAMVVFLLAVIYIVVSARLRPGREEVVEPDGDTPDGDAVALDKKSDTKSDTKADSKADDEAAETTDKKSDGKKLDGKKPDAKTDTESDEPAQSTEPAESEEPEESVEAARGEAESAKKV
jgi:hypothetical protein